MTVAKKPLRARFAESFRAFLAGAAVNMFAAAALLFEVLFILFCLSWWLGGISGPDFAMAGERLLALVRPVARGVEWLVAQLKELGWPQVALLGLLLLILSSRAQRGLGLIWKRAKRVKWGDVEIDLTPESAKALATTAEESFKVYRKQADLFIRHQVSALDVRSYLEQTISDTSLKIAGASMQSVPDFRCTLYIRDVLFADTLYQLTEYYPYDGRATAGRTFSSRFGIIGRAWRAGIHLGEANVSSAYEELVREWGMTQEEARRGSRNRPAYVCAVLRAAVDGKPGLPVGVFFADSTKPSAFGTKTDAETIAAKVAEAAVRSELAERLKELRNELNKYSAAIDTLN